MNTLKKTLKCLAFLLLVSAMASVKAMAVLPEAADDTKTAVLTAFTDFGTMMASILPAALLITVAFVAYKLLTKGLKLGK